MEKKNSGRQKAGRPEKTKSSKQEAIWYETYRFNTKELCITVTAGILTGLAVVWICYCDVRALPAAIPVLYLVMRIRRRQLCRQRILLLQAHFKDFLSALYSCMAAGYSLENSVNHAAQDMEKLYGPDDVLVRELREIIRELSLQVPVERLFYDLGNRSACEDLRSFGEILMIVKRTGGNMDKALKECRATICERIDTRQEIETVIAAKQYEQRLMSVMPAGMILYLRLSFGSFMDCLYGNLTGAMIMTAALAVYAAAIWIGMKIVRIEV
ncbi:MAG: type II secretion system F family protein [Eubacterium sp.]|nr:type II secretion system F family protein [Eubacterium sp.]